MRFHLQDLFSEDAARTVAAAAAGRVCIIIGIHLCGELSRRAIQLWERSGAAALVLSPCCLVGPRTYCWPRSHVIQRMLNPHILSYGQLDFISRFVQHFGLDRSRGAGGRVGSVSRSESYGHNNP